MQKEYEPLRESLAQAQSENVPEIMKGGMKENEEEDEDTDEGNIAAASQAVKFAKAKSREPEKGNKLEEGGEEGGADVAELRMEMEREFAQYAITADDASFAQVCILCVHIYIYIYIANKYVCISICSLSLYACMYVCMYVCMHACMQVCFYLCMYVCKYEYYLILPASLFYELYLNPRDLHFLSFISVIRLLAKVGYAALSA